MGLELQVLLTLTFPAKAALHSTLVAVPSINVIMLVGMVVPMHNVAAQTADLQTSGPGFE